MRAWLEALCSMKRRGNGAAESLCQTSAIDDQRGSCNPTRHRTCQEQYGVRNIFRRADARERSVGRFAHKSFGVLPELLALAAQHGRIDVSGADAIHADVVLAVINRHGAR